MAKELPYFKFFTGEWANGSITLEDYSVQGIFINLCCWYWSKQGRISEKHIRKRFKSDEEIDILIEENIIIVDEEGVVSISFLDEQMVESESRSKTNSKNAKLGWNKNRKKAQEYQSDLSQVYIIVLKYEDETFLKVGQTSGKISRRFSGKLIYSYTIAYQLFGKDVTKCESSIQEYLNDYRYTPKHKFAGHMECFNIKALSELQGYNFKQHDISQVCKHDFATVSQSESIQLTEEKEKNKEEEKRIRKEKELKVSELFERFWNLYDKKTNRDKCFKKFLTLKSEEMEQIFRRS